MTTIHPTAIIDPKAVLGTGVQIGPFCTIGPDVVLGDGVCLVSHVVISGHTQIGANTLVHPMAFLGGPPQHLAQARLRAIEEGLPVVRATPTGISAVIDANGRIIKSLPLGISGRIDAVVPQAKAPTLFARFGNILPLGFAGLLIACALLPLARRARSR